MNKKTGLILFPLRRNLRAILGLVTQSRDRKTMATTGNSRSKLLHHTHKMINDSFKSAYHETRRHQIIFVFINGTECTLDNHDWILTDLICTRPTSKSDLRWNRVSRLQPSVCETETIPLSNLGAR
ncbi:hypothetical protein AVEN_136123-1 [Araneus ventricosus]|uniref:Uncharacterized protein n=1 Tax=Araneus ventricosus TaxID=182803 RepID=A0A4Y2VFP5_ARAVE|nr:hypothetical protein AVEN_136123-1 [Araneus ventricosus]